MRSKRISVATCPPGAIDPPRGARTILPRPTDSFTDRPMLYQIAPLWRDRLFAGGGVLLAVICGFFTARGGFLIPTLVIAASLAVIVSMVRTTVFQACVIGSLVVGYVVGNRGFAQFSLVPGLPLLPGESAIMVLASLQIIRRAVSADAARARISPMDVIVFLWIVIGGVRFLFDFRTYGFNALRDFATVYYAVFFFLAQNVARQSPSFGQRLIGVVRISAVVMLVTHRLWQLFPEVFFNVLQVGGIPLIFYKADLVGIYLAIGALLQYLRFEERGGWWRWVVIGAMCFEILGTDNRAAMLALAMGGTWLVVGGRWRLTFVTVFTVILGVVGTLWIARTNNTPWEDTPLRGFYEKVVSVVDPTGQGHYRGEDTFNKGDNNRYRLVWWSLLTRETLEKNPVAGLGFGYDLARTFMQTYYGDNSGDYAVRSPHSIVVTIFARMGFVGLLPFLLLIALCARKTWRALNTPDSPAVGLWIAAWVIFVSACFGVVLEGPMGAVVFWLLLGAANGQTAPPETTTPATEAGPVEDRPLVT